MLKPFLVSLLDCIFPPLCQVCRSFIPNADDVHVCPSCREKMPLIVAPLCSRCGIPFAGVGDDHICGACIRDRPHFDAARAAFVYEGPCRDMIHAFKYHNKTHLRRPLGLLTAGGLSEFITSVSADLIMPVPLHRTRLRSRGFNQAILLGEIFSRHTRIPLVRDNLRRIRWTEPQVNLAAAERRTNVTGAFSIRESSTLEGRSILLVDDVLTTGSTVDECAKVLKSAGASRVLVVTVARALSP